MRTLSSNMPVEYILVALVFATCVLVLREKGYWVCLQNCHLAETFMPFLQQLYERFQQETVHPRFRLFLTSQPTNILPTSLLKQSIKIITEPPTVCSLASSSGFRRYSLYACLHSDLRTAILQLPTCLYAVPSGELVQLLSA